MKKRLEIPKEYREELSLMTRNELNSRLRFLEEQANTLVDEAWIDTEKELRTLREECALIVNIIRWHDYESRLKAKRPEVLVITLSSAPKFGERILLLILRTKEERIHIPGDLEEEFKQITAKHGARYAKLWYYKQVAASAWPLICKAVQLGVWASVGEWIRRVF
jgi:hypothetical protein